MKPSQGEVAAVVGFGGQYALAARVILAKLSTLEWIRVADPEAGVADDFQFKSGARRHALQVKWSQLPGSFTWSDLTSGASGKTGLLTDLAAAWHRLREASTDQLSIYLCTNNHASTATTSGSTPIGRSTADGPRSLAAFLARSFEPVRALIGQGATRWSDLAQVEEVERWAPVWEALRSFAGLTDDEFIAFVRDLELRFGLHHPDPLIRPDDDHSAVDISRLAQTLLDLVRDPSRPVQLSREELMDRLGWSGRLRYRHPHQFPVPTVYTTNDAARAELESKLGALTGGYVALVGPAGCGKSTLLSTLDLGGHVTRYYAFVPDAPDPLSSRGEADSFLHDLSLGLEESGLARRGIANDLRSQQTVLLDQLDRAGSRWRERREPTVIVVDGLDHIPREQNPSRSLLEALPSPASLPEGVFVILGTQTVTILPTSVQTALDQQERIASVPRLSAAAVECLAEAAGLSTWLYPGQRTTLVDVSEGHPLALTYLLQELSALEEREPDIAARRARADRLLADASVFGGDIAARYRGYFRAVSGDQHVLDLLGMVARLRVSLNLEWLSTWADPHVVSAFIDRTAIFFHRHDSDWRFIHNSFRRFLADETARVAGKVDETRDRRFHQDLADLCANAGPKANLYRDEEIAHRFLSGQHDRVLELATPERLRKSLLDLRPLQTVRDHALLGLRSATVTDDASAFFGLLLFLNELALRRVVLEAESLADAVGRFDADLALEHVVRGGRLRIKPASALDHAARYASAGDVGAVQQILRACGGLAGLTTTERPSPVAVETWAEVALQLSGLDAVLAELDHHLALPTTDPAHSDPVATSPGEGDVAEHGARQRQLHERREREVNTAHCRNRAHARCFDLLIEARDDEALDVLTGVIDAEAAPDWRSRARFMRARAASDDRARAEVLRWVREIIGIAAEYTAEDDDLDGTRCAVPLGVRGPAAELLVRNGFVDAPEVERLVPQGTRIAWPSASSADNGLEPFRILLGLLCLREVRPDPTLADPMPPVAPSRREIGDERFQGALRTLAALEGQQLAAEADLGEPPAVAAHADPIIRLLEVPLDQTRDWSGWYIIREAALGLYRRLIDVATDAGGSAGLMRLLAQFDTAWTTPGRRDYWAPERRQAVIAAAITADRAAVPWAIERLRTLDTEIDSRSHDPNYRVTLWLKQSKAWAAAGDSAAAQLAAQSAVRASLGVGASDHDSQLFEWVDWLATAAQAGTVTGDELIAAIRLYASRITSACADASTQAETASERLIALTFRHDAPLACELAERLCDEGVIGEAATIQAVVLAACRTPGIPVGVAAAAAANLLYPIDRQPSADIEASVRARSIEDEGHSLALLQQATQVWTAREESPDSVGSRQPSDNADEQDRERDTTLDEVETIGALLKEMRNANSTDQRPRGGWNRAVERTATGTVPAAMARALLEQATRLHIEGAAIGGLAALAARSGEPELAVATLADVLSRNPGYGWLRYMDGGTRLTLFGAALQDRHPVLVQLARSDLANCLATGSLSSHISPGDLRRIIELIAGPDYVAKAWPDVDRYLDQVAPADARVAEPDSRVPSSGSPLEVFTRWLVQYLGHPVRALDFGARRSLQVTYQHDPTIGQKVFAEAITAGGWTTEAALLALITTPINERPATISSGLAEALVAAAAGPDAISRDLARQLAHVHGLQLPSPQPRPLPAGYKIALPPLPRRATPELDRYGIPHVDQNDPQQVVAPFDEPLQLLAELSELDPSTTIHRAAALVKASQEPWISGDQHSHAQRLTDRQQRHGFRPWAYMAGRRALGVVVAELADAGLLDDLQPYPAFTIGLVDTKLARVQAQPLPMWIPDLWRPPGTQTYSVQGWCTETKQATQQYRESYSVASPYVLAEHSQWRSLEWEKPSEDRWVQATHRDAPANKLLMAPKQAWETSYSSGAQDYPNNELDWDDEQLVLYGHEVWSDGASLRARLMWIMLVGSDMILRRGCVVEAVGARRVVGFGGSVDSVVRGASAGWWHRAGR